MISYVLVSLKNMKNNKIAIEEGYELHTILSFEEARESLDPLKSI